MPWPACRGSRCCLWARISRRRISNRPNSGSASTARGNSVWMTRWRSRGRSRTRSTTHTSAGDSIILVRENTEDPGRDLLLMRQGLDGAEFEDFLTPSGSRATQKFRPTDFWSPDGNTLYYGRDDGTGVGTFMAVRIQRNPVPVVLSTDSLFTATLPPTLPRLRSPSGRRPLDRHAECRLRGR